MTAALPIPASTWLWALAVGLGLAVSDAPAQESSANDGPRTLDIGVIFLDADRRYDDNDIFYEYPLAPRGRPVAGVDVALAESRFIGQAVNIEFRRRRVRARSPAQMAAAIPKMVERGVQFVILDAPAEVVAEVAAESKGQDVVLFNVTAREDRLRHEACQPHLLHTLPSYTMMTDALAQYLVSKRWRRVLALRGPTAGDRALFDAFTATAERFNLDVVAQRDFVLSNDPREREANNVALLTGNADYDVVFVADAKGEFARLVPYRTVRPRPVVGGAGLLATAWHWSWERHGAPQLEKRFEEAAERRMGSTDWAAWMAVKAVVEAALRTRSTDFATLRDYLLGDEIVLDGFKGNPVSFRPWNRQLRQPMLLHTEGAVIARAPLEGFLHPSNDLDTLGVDERASRCRL